MISLQLIGKKEYISLAKKYAKQIPFWEISPPYG
jgi:hypothetical protein